MRKYLFNTLRYFFRAFMILVLLICIYIMAIFISLWFPANSDFEASAGRTHEIYVVSNGVHTDVVLPIDTSRALDRYLLQRQGQGRSCAYIAYGWGDKGFYLDTPTWADLKFSTAFNAAFGLSTSAMHITLYPTKPRLTDPDTYTIRVNQEQLARLQAYVSKDFKLHDDSPHYINCCWYYSDKRDGFYDAQGRYSLFKTCNVWTNSALKHAGVKTALWAPFSACVTYHLK